MRPYNRWWTRCSSAPSAFRRELVDEARKLRLVVEAYSPLGTGRHLANDTVNRIAASSRPHTGAGALALVRAARSRSDRQIHPPRANRREFPHLRLRAVSRGYDRARRPRPHRRNRTGSRTQMVVTVTPTVISTGGLPVLSVRPSPWSTPFSARAFTGGAMSTTMKMQGVRRR